MDVREQVLELLGVLVVAYDEGARLGKVCDIYVDRKACRITGMAISTGLPGFDSASYVGFKHVRILGKDVVIVASQKAVTPLPKGIDETSLKLLKNVRLATRDGAYVGRLLDVSVDVSSGNISQLMLSEQEYLNIEVRSTAIGADLIILPPNIQKKTKKVARGKEVKKVQAKKPDSVTTLFESATKRVLEAAKDTKKRFLETAKRTADQASQAMHPATEKPQTTASPATTAADPTKAAASPATTTADPAKAADGPAETAARTSKKKRAHRAGLPKKR